MGEINMAEEKINGFDKWDVEQAARKFIEVEEIKKRPKFFKTVIKELERQAKAAQEALKKTGENNG